nr:ribonuclease H-like domain-containing protein [Tanacetum cinerariifolium]
MIDDNTLGKVLYIVHPHVNKDTGIVDSGCSRSMTRNKEKLDDFVQVKGGAITFGGGDGKITRKGTTRTSKLNFENVYYMEELQHFNLFSLSQIGDKKNKVIFTHNECLVLTKEFQLPDESQTEAVSTACYVLNRVSITNPHNKTPYELLSGKVPNIIHLKPFRCQVTILNTSDHLGKFKRKANEGFLVGYAANSTQDTNINTGTQDDDSESECDEKAILVPFFPSNSFSGRKVNEVSETIENHLDYAEELARLQRQEHEAHSAAKKNLVLAAAVPAGSIPTSSVPASSVPASSVPAGSIPTSSVPASSVPAGGVLAGSVDSAGFGDPATSESVPAVFNLDHADHSTLPPGYSLGSSEHSTRFPSLSDLGNHQPKAGIFSSSSYDDAFYADVTNLASSV